MGAESVGLFTELINQGGVIAGVIVAFLFASKLLQVFTPFIQGKLDKTSKASPPDLARPTGETRRIASDETIRAHLTRPPCVPADVDLRRLMHQVDDLYNWHKTTDPTGAFPWKISPVLHAAVESLAESNRQIAGLLERLIDGQDAITSRLDKLEQRAHER